MRLLALGLNHNTAPLSVREAVSFSSEDIARDLPDLRDRCVTPAKGGVREAMILSTCNRTEFFLAAEDPTAAFMALSGFIAEKKGVSLKDFLPHTYRYEQLDVARHTFRVASGLDSMVLGETQIVGQFKKACREAREAGTMGFALGHLFDSTLAAAKEVRSSTAIGSSSISLAAAAVRLALQLFGDISRQKILFVGAGEMIELCAAHFCAHHPREVTVANRTLERGRDLADRFGAGTMELKNLPSGIAAYDIIVTCTASALPIIGLGMMQRAVQQRRHRPVLVIDLAVPRDVEEEVSRLDDVYAYTIDDLGKVVASGRESRREAVSQAESIIEAKVGEFASWMASREAVPDIRALIDRAEGIRTAETEKAKSRLLAGEDPVRVMDAMSRSLTRKLIHDPVSILRNGSGGSPEERKRNAELLRNFFLGRRHR